MDIACLADKGGVGKSLICAHLAARYAQLGFKVQLLDLDRCPSASRWLQRASAPVETFCLEAPTTSSYDVRIIDTPAHPSGEMRAHLLAVCDVLVVVAIEDIDSQLNAITLAGELAKAGSAAVRVVLNNVPPSANADLARQDMVSLGAPVARSVVRRYACYTKARADGRLVCDYPYPGADNAWSDIRALVTELEEIAHGKA